MKKTALILLVLFLLTGCSLFDWEKKTKNKLMDNEKELLEVINLVKNDELELVNNRLYNLPENLNYLSDTGKISVYQNNDEGIQVGFFMLRGLQSGSYELMYSSAGEDMIKYNETGHPIVEIIYLKENWYYVATEY